MNSLRCHITGHTSLAEAAGFCCAPGRPRCAMHWNQTAAIVRRVMACALIVCASADAQKHWNLIARPTTKNLFKVSFLDSLRGWAAGGEGAIVKTTDGGNSWTTQNSGVTTDIQNIFMVNERIGLAISLVAFVDTSTFYGTRILKTTDGGTNWVKEDFPVVGVYFHTVLLLDTLDGWLGGERGTLFKTTNMGIQWKKTEVESSFCAYFPILNVQFFSPQCGFAMGGTFDFAGMTIKTVDGGKTWTSKCVSPEPVYALHFIDSVTIAGIVGDFDFGSSMIRSSDGGETWEYTNLGVFGQPHTMTFRTAYEGWVPAGDRFLVTYDTARTWSIADTLTGRSVFDAAFTDSTTGFAVTDSGMVFKYKKDITDVRETASFPVTPRLLQSYPNPFNPSVTIIYQIPSSSFVSIKVIDVLGREVATLVSEVRPPGRHEVTWHARNASSGFYFYQLQAGTFRETKKMLLLR